MQRVTIGQLKDRVNYLNKITGNPTTYATKNDKGFIIHIGNYHLDEAYGGVNLVQTINNGGGITCPIGMGYRTKRELLSLVEAYIRGTENGKELIRQINSD